MTLLPFTKMHGLGNDFVMVDSRNLPNLNTLDIGLLTQTLCDRHYGVGADGLIIAAPPSNPDQFDLRFIYYNHDGQEAEMCGNGIRCFARFAEAQGLVDKKKLTVETLAGPIKPTLEANGLVTVDMGQPILDWPKIPTATTHWTSNNTLSALGTEIVATPVSMGNPHIICFQDDQDFPLDPAQYGPVIETHPAFPAKTNVEFVTLHDDQTVDVVVWERGCGFTLACGTGACAVAVAGVLTGKTRVEVTVNLPGGPLNIRWDRNGDNHVWMTGPATTVFQGEFPLHLPVMTGQSL